MADTEENTQISADISAPPVQPTAETSALSKPQYRGLKPWQPGQSGNPGGKPRKPLTDKLLKRLADNGGEEIAQVVGALLKHAKNTEEPKVAGASVKAIAEIFDRVEGKVPQAVTGEDGGPLSMALMVVHVGREK